MEKNWVRVERGGNKSVAVFVHGIMGDYRQTWGDFPDLFNQDNQLSHCDTLCWGYPSSLLSRGYWLSYIPMIGSKMPDLPSVADALASDLGNPEIAGKYTDLFLIGHSMGGLVIKQMIISSLTKFSPNNELLDRIRCVVLYATPSDGVELPNVLRIHPQAKSIRCSADFISDLRGDWINRVHAVKREDPPMSGKRHVPVTAVLGLEDNAVPAKSAASFYVQVETAHGNHLSVCKPKNRDHTSFQILKREIIRHSQAADQEKAPMSVSAMRPEKQDDEPKKMPSDSHSWDFSQILDLGDKKDFEAARKLAESNYQSSAKDGSDLDTLAFFYYTLFFRGWADGINALQKLAESHKDNSEVFLWLGLAHARNEHYENAVNALIRHRDLIAEPLKRIEARRTLASHLELAGRFDLALEELRKAVAECVDHTELSKTYKALGEIYIKQKKTDIMLGVACFEKAVSLNPMDTDLRFKLAHEHASDITPSVSLYHYEKILALGPNEVADNNAGCQADELKLPLKARDHFLKAVEKESSLAMANVALQLINAGFEKQAREYLELARKQDGYDGHVDKMLVLLRERRENEGKTLDELRIKAKEVIKWRCEEADALIASPLDPLNLQGIYTDSTGKKINIVIDMEDGKLVGAVADDTEEMKFVGTVEGRLLRFQWNANPKKASLSILQFNAPTSGKGSFISDESGNTLRGYRTTTSDEIRCLPWTIRRVTRLSADG